MTPLEGLVAYWEGLTPQSLARLGEVYAPDAYFRDPFNEVRGIPGLQRVFGHMYETLEAPRFVIVETIAQGEAAVLLWDFEFRIRSLAPATVRRIHGASHVRFAPDGRVAYHRDYWDAAGELYAQLPLVGPLARFMARRLAAK
jgi:hypothetical protein